MNMLHSEQKATQFKTQAFTSRRETKTTIWQFRATPQVLFPLLCAMREADWLEGVEHQLIYSQSAYAEPDYIFKSDFFGLGQEVWVRFAHVANKYIGYYRFSAHVIVKFEIGLHDNYNGTVDTCWRSTFTGLDEEGNRVIEALPPQLTLDDVMQSLQHYIDSGEMQQVEKP